MNRFTYLPLTFFLITTIYLQSCAQRPDIDPIYQQLKELFSQQKKFNGNVLIAKEGKIIFNESFGFIDDKRTTRLTKNSKFNVGSICKVFPALALLDLIEKGQLSLNDTLSKFLPNLPIWSDYIQIKDLLFYKSGLPTVQFQKSNTDKSMLENLQSIQSLQHPSGSQFLYSNLNNFIQSLIIEHLTGKDFRAYIQNKFFKPLKIKNVTYSNFPPTQENGFVKAYSEYYGDDILNNPIVKQFDVGYAHLYMSTHDLFRLSQWIRKKFDSTSSVHQFFFQDNFGSEIIGPFGAIKLKNEVIVLNENWGSAYSFLTLLYANYKDQTTIILTNSFAYPNQYEDMKMLKEKIIKLLEE